MPTSYPLDTTGLSPGNLVSNEIHTLTEVNSAPYRILIPTFAPFYLDNFVLVHEDTTGTLTTLIEGSDYIQCLPYIGASRSTGKMLYGGITISNSIYNGTIRITYQTVGGDWIADSNYVRERLVEMAYNPRLTLWDVVTNKPNQFPPTQHGQPSDTVYGQQELINSINSLADTIVAQAAAPSNNAMSAALHPLRTDNPHNTTATQVGLGDVENLPIADMTEVLAHTAVRKYITLDQVLALQATYTVTKEEIGLGNVDNTSDANKPVSNLQQAAIDNARNVAINTASDDATVKAGNAYASALAEASLDASAKANAAENAARNASTPVSHIGTGGNSHALATTSSDGFFSSQEKIKLAAITGTNTGDQTDIPGNSATAGKLATARAIAITGDATYTVNFDGSSDVTAVLTLANTPIAPGAYAKVQVDGKGRVVGNTPLIASDIPNIDATKITSGTLSQDTSGNAATATKLITQRSISITGDGTWNVNFDGTVNVSNAFTLADTGVVVGQYTKLTVDSKGRVLAGTNLVESDIPNLSGSKIVSGISVDTTGNAATATKLTTPRSINGVAFDGTSNIVINAVDTTDRIAVTEKGVANGVATLDSNGLIPSNQLPSYVDDIQEFANLAALPLAGESGKIYVTLDNNKIYRWSGTVYIEVSPTSGTSDAATRLATARTITITGDGSWQVTFDGNSNVSNSLTLSNTGVVAGTHTKVTVDSKGRVLTGASLQASDIPNLDASKINSGTLSVPTTGNAATATKFATARTINGVAFDGTSNVTINAVDATARIAQSEKGAPNGVASLDGDGLIHPSHIPSSLDDVIEAVDVASFPAVGSQGKIYIDLSTNNMYRWNGSAYISLTTPPVATRYMTAASFYVARG